MEKQLLEFNVDSDRQMSMNQFPSKSYLKPPSV